MTPEWVTRTVQLRYTDPLGRDGDQAGVDYWVRMVASHGRVAVAYSFYQSLESRMDRVDLLYESLLHRPSDIAGQAYWAGKILASGDVALATNLALSAEYYASAAVRFP
jgi:hypothetical protein